MFSCSGSLREPLPTSTTLFLFHRNHVKAKILIAEEDEGLSEVLRGLFRSLDHRVKTSSDLKEVRRLLRDEPWQVLFCSAGMWQASLADDDLLAAARLAAVPVPVVLMAAYAEFDLGEDAIKAGATAWLPKPIRSAAAIRGLEQALSQTQATALEAPAPAEQPPEAVERHFGVLVGEHDSMRQLYDQIDKIADTDMTVLLRGESGTGKELFALAVHNASQRARRPFVAVNCAALPEQLLESELFGHLKGSFTGAVRNKEGLFQTAEGGTLFLDEIGSISINMQLTLLRVLQERKIRPVGGNAMLSVDVRVIAATNEDLEKRIQDGFFRRDLYYRLSVMPIIIPPLRERRSDIGLLANWFLSQISGQDGGQFTLAPAALQALENYSWPGNVRELENTIKRAVALGGAAGHVVQLDDLPDNIRTAAAPPPAEPVDASAAAMPSIAGQLMTLKAYLRQCERHYIRQVMDECDGDKKAAAKISGVSLGTFYRKLEEHQP